MQHICKRAGVFKYLGLGFGLAILNIMFCRSELFASGGEHASGGHVDPFSLVMLGMAFVVTCAMMGRWVAESFDQPLVLGELLIGVIIGNIGYWVGHPLSVLIMHLDSASTLFTEIWSKGISISDAAPHIFSSEELSDGGFGAKLIMIMAGLGSINVLILGVSLWIFSNFGVILLLFMVGLESSIHEMMKVGLRALVIAVIGVVIPFILGLLVGQWLLPDSSMPVKLFLSATLCATSVGITARVFKDLKNLKSPEAKLVLGAAVIDDVLALVLLAVVVGIVSTGKVNVLEISRISLLSIVFIVAVLMLGERITRAAFRVAEIFDKHHNRLLFPLVLAFAMSWLANQIGLATIVGAFAAGLIINDHFIDDEGKEATLNDLISPLERIFAPIFFVLMGMQVNLASFVRPGTFILALVFTLVAIIGKLVAGMPAGKGIDRLSVGIGMVPRGEVGLIFASIGKGLGVVTDSVFSALVIMIILTTLMTPPALKWSIERSKKA